MRDQLADELNVLTIDPLNTTGEDLVQVTAKANFRTLGKRFGNRTPSIAAAVADADAADLAGQLRTKGSAELVVAGDSVQLEPDDVVFTEIPREGWAVQHLGGESIALDLTLTPALRRVGLARDVVRLVQEARKSSGLAVTDRIQLQWTAEGELAAAITEHQPFIADEVLAVSMSQESDLTTAGTAAAAGQESVEHGDAELGLTFRVQRVRVDQD